MFVVNPAIAVVVEEQQVLIAMVNPQCVGDIRLVSHIVLEMTRAKLSYKSIYGRSFMTKMSVSTDVFQLPSHTCARRRSK